MKTDNKMAEVGIKGRTGICMRFAVSLFAALFLLPPCVGGQTTPVMKTGATTLEEVSGNIKKQTKYQVFYDEEKVDTSRRISVTAGESALEDILVQALTPLKLTHGIINDTIVVSRRGENPRAQGSETTVTGYIYDENGQPLTGARITKAGKKTAVLAVTDGAGRFSMKMAAARETFTVRCLGYLDKAVTLTGGAETAIYLEPDTFHVGEVVVTGYFPKARNSFTGTAVAVKGDELRNINNVSFFDALQVFDPSFRVIDESGIYGSDPNKVPDRIEIRGQNSFPEISENELKTYTSLPVFILDGFEVTVGQVYDLDMNRINSVTILKDAAAAAIYGSRAANGVVVIESNNPEAGKLRIAYTLTGSLQIPDLSSYNLMNAAEIVEFQRLAGVFDSAVTGEDAGNRLNMYNAIKKEMMAGTDTYWLSKPLRVALQQKHSLVIDGAVKQTEEDSRDNIRYQINIGVSANDGVMKGSSRNQYSAGTKLLYNNGKLYATNDIQVSLVNSRESPYGRFSDYTGALPYFREKDSEGRYYRTLTMRNVAPPDMDLGVASGFGMSQLSPVYEARYLSSFTRNESVNFYDNFGLNWTLTPTLMVKSNFRFSHSSSRTDVYVSPMSHSYIETNNDTDNTPEVILDRGRYDLSNSSSLALSGNVVASYTESFGRHLIQAIAGGEISQHKSKGDDYVVTGFMDDALTYLSHANQFNIHGRPGGSESTVRSAGAFTNINYGYDNRYMIDITGRLDGSSLFGRNNFTAPFWSAGARWNISHEEFMSGVTFVRNLSLRATTGTIGNRNFSLNQAMTLYSWLTAVYGPYMGATVSTLGNPDLRCQVTHNRNIGLEFTLGNGLVNVNFNYYDNITKSNITDITIAPSIGYSSYKTNMGDLQNKGVDFSVSATPVKNRDWTVNVYMNGASNRNKIRKISETMSNYNDMIGRIAERDGVNVFLFKEGQSMSTIYAVRSLGIDPGTGREMYLTKDNERTFTWNADDQVAVGNREADLSGYFGLNVRYRMWDMGAAFNYSTGADRYNHTLHDKIEGVNPMVNNDRRALTERWKEPGDVARYKSIGDGSITRSTSRFVQKEHMMSLSSLRVSYTLPTERMHRTAISMMRFSVTVNDLFHVSTIRQERGLNYPFARTMNFSAQINF